MKKKILLITLLLTMFSGGYALATTVNGQWNGLPIVKLTSQGQPVEASESPAVILNDRTYVPLSALKSLGIQLDWNAADYSVSVELPKPETIIKKVHELTQAQLDEIAKSVALTYAVDDALYATTQGTGFLLNNGVFITNEHVGGFSKAIQYYLYGKTLNNNGVTLFRNTTTDIYAVQTNETGGLKYSTKLPEIGDDVWAIGYPHGKLSISKGNVTGIESYQGVTKIKNTAHTESGESGGVLVNGEGEVIGITSSIIEETGDNFSIPMQYVQDELNKLK